MCSRPCASCQLMLCSLSAAPAASEPDAVYSSWAAPDSMRTNEAHPQRCWALTALCSKLTSQPARRPVSGLLKARASQGTRHPHPKTLSAAAVANKGSFGLAETKAAISAVTEQPAAVMRVSIWWPLLTCSERLPSVTCERHDSACGALPANAKRTTAHQVNGARHCHDAAS